MTNKIFRISGAAVALLFAGAAAQAADLRQPSYKAPAYTSPVYSNWTGFYVGLNAGYGFGSSNWDVPAVAPSPKGFLGGITDNLTGVVGFQGGSAKMQDLKRSAFDEAKTIQH